MRLVDLLEEGLKRSMDKLKEKERDKVSYRTASCSFILSSCRLSDFKYHRLTVKIQLKSHQLKCFCCRSDDCFALHLRKRLIG